MSLDRLNRIGHAASNALHTLEDELRKCPGPVTEATLQAIRDIEACLERGMQARRVCAKVDGMRKVQREYFKTRDRLLVPRAKKLESEVDAQLDALRLPNQGERGG